MCIARQLIVAQCVRPVPECGSILCFWGGFQVLGTGWILCFSLVLGLFSVEVHFVLDLFFFAP